MDPIRAHVMMSVIMKRVRLIVERKKIVTVDVA